MTAPYYQDDQVTLWHGDALAVLREMQDGSVDCIVTSPPYFGLRDYGVDGQLGLERSPADYIANLTVLLSEARRVLADDGTFWLNIGDTYVSRQFGWGITGAGTWASIHREAGDGRPDPDRTVPFHAKSNSLSKATGLPNKSLIGIPWRLAISLQESGWTLRQEIIWHKPNGAPARLSDRFQSRHEHVFLFSKSPRYWFDVDAVEEPGDVWRVTPEPFSEAHFAVMPSALAERCILAGCKPGGTVLDPFSGSGTTGMAAAKHGRRYVGIDLNADYLDLSLRTRLSQGVLDFAGL